jgi:hypothetical protein
MLSKFIDTILPSTPVEDFDHTFPCEDPQRRGWRSKLRTDLTKLLDQSNTNPVLGNIILEGLHHWFHQTSSTTVVPVSTLRQFDCEPVSDWMEPVPPRPMVSTVESSSALIPTLDRHPPDASEQHAMVGFIIKLIWKHCPNKWLNRNTILHGNTH